MEKDRITKKFEKHLLEEGFQRKTMLGYRNAVRSYLDWCETNAINPKKVSLDESYDYIAYKRAQTNEQGKPLSDRTVHIHKTAVKHFNEFLGLKSNPMLMVKLNKCQRHGATNLLEEEFLATIYRDIEANSLVQKRDRCIMGCFLFLGMTRTDVVALELEHLDLELCRIYVPKTNNSNERYIDLKPQQVNHLMNYVYDIRPRLMNERTEETGKLFFSLGESDNLNGFLCRTLKRVRKAFPYVKSFQQLRQSRVALWVKEKGLREAQYLGGYRYVTSVQRYDFTTTEDLRNKLVSVHPMEQMR